MIVQRLDNEELKRVKFHTKINGYPRLPLGSIGVAKLYSEEIRAGAATNDIARMHRAKMILYYCLS